MKKLRHLPLCFRIINKWKYFLPKGGKMENGISSYSRFLSGDKDAIDEIIRDYKDGLVYFLYSIIGDMGQAEEAAIDTFVKLYVDKPTFKGKCSFKTWLYTIGRNKAFDIRRKFSKFSSVSLDDAFDISDEENIEQKVIDDERRSDLRRLISKLKPEYSQVLYLIFFEDFIAILMIFRYMEKKNPVFLEFHQLKAQMTIYTLAMLYHVTNGNISLYKIWQNQGLSDNLKKFIDELAKQLFQRLTADKPETSTFRDFCKSPKTWDATKKYILSLDFSMITDDFKSKNEDAVRKDAVREITDKERKEVEKYGVAFWDGLSKLSGNLYSEIESKTMLQIVQAMTSNKQLSQVLVFEAKQMLKKFAESGMSQDYVIALSSRKTIRKEKDSAAMFKRIQKLTDENWTTVRILAGRICDESDAKIVKKIAAQKDRSKLTFKQLTVVCRTLDLINEKFKDKIKEAF